MPDSDGHEAIKVCSTARLQQACETAVKKRKYNSLDMRTRLESVFPEQSKIGIRVIRGVRGKHIFIKKGFIPAGFHVTGLIVMMQV
jgi:hypothetical protein